MLRLSLNLIGLTYLLWPHYSLIGSNIDAFLPGEAVHATDDLAVHGCPLYVTYLPPLASVFHLQEPLSDRNSFSVGVGGSDPHVLHLHCHTLRHRQENTSTPSGFYRRGAKPR